MTTDDPATPPAPPWPPGFDPWTATEAEALQASGARSVVERFIQPKGSPLRAWHAAQRLASARDEIVRGRGMDVLDAVASCAMYRLVMPDWLAEAYLRRWGMVAAAEVGSWDAPEAFGQPYHGTSADKEKARRHQRIELRLLAQVYLATRKDQGASLKRLWSAIGRGTKNPSADDLAHFGADLLAWIGRLDYKRTTATELWREVKELFGEPRELQEWEARLILAERAASQGGSATF